MSNCHFCEEYAKSFHDPLKLHNKWDEQGNPRAFFADYAAQGYYLNYCPECGRNLKEIREGDKVYPSIYAKLEEIGG